MSKTFFVNGISGTALIIDTTNEASPYNKAQSVSSYPVTSSYPFASITNFNTAYKYLQITGQTLVSSATFPQVDADIRTWPDGGCDCFTEDTEITMHDNSKKAISKITVGDRVLGINNTINTVTFIEKVPDSIWGELYSPDPKMSPFITINHPIYIAGQLYAVNVEEVYNLYPWLGKPQQLEEYKTAPATGANVYNLWVTNDGTYIANGFQTTSIMFSGYFLSYSFTRGWLTQSEIVNLLIYFTNKGKHTQYGSYLINKLLSYVKPNILLKLVAKSLAKDEGLAKITIITLGKLLGRMLHPNK